MRYPLISDQYRPTQEFPSINPPAYFWIIRLDVILKYCYSAHIQLTVPLLLRVLCTANMYLTSLVSDK